MKTIQVTTSILAIAILTGCATDDPNRRAKAGALIGAVAGVAIGNQVDKDGAEVLGAALGGFAGYKVGQYMDNQQQELEAALAEELESKQIELTRLENDILRVNLTSEASFDIDKADLKAPFYPSLDKISEILAKYDRTDINVLGYTDSTGEESYNQILSERRSEAVSTYFLGGGINAARLSTEGMGESSPRAPNDTPENRRKNRRVEIDLIPVVEAEA